MNTISIFLRTDQIKKNKTNAVCLRITINRRKKVFSLGVSVFKRDWNTAKKIVKKTDADFQRKNKLIQKHFLKAQTIVDKYFFDDKNLNLDEFARLFANKEYFDSDFYQFAFDFIEKSHTETGTKKTRFTTLTKLKQYKPVLKFSDITIKFIEDFIFYMKEILKNNENTRNKTLSILKMFVTAAIAENLIKENVFEKIKITRVVGKRNYLTIEEVEILERYFSGNAIKDSEKRVLRYFLFSCYTGIPFCDLEILTFENLEKRFFEGRDTFFICFDRHKTDINSDVPLIKKAADLIDFTRLRNQTVFDLITNQKTNAHIKTILKAVGIVKRISFHSARHTFATNAMEYGIPIEVVSKLLGHTEIKTTQIYAKVSEGLKYKEMKKFE